MNISLLFSAVIAVMVGVPLGLCVAKYINREIYELAYPPIVEEAKEAKTLE